MAGGSKGKELFRFIQGLSRGKKKPLQVGKKKDIPENQKRLRHPSEAAIMGWVEFCKQYFPIMLTSPFFEELGSHVRI